jgi:Protein of unknown function (DUF2846)
MKQLVLIGFIIGSAIFAGCRSVPMTSASLDSDAKEFQPEPGKASIYINRKEAFVGGGNIVQTVIDGRIIGSLIPGTYQLIHVTPGKHVLTYTGQSGDLKLTEIQVDQGQNYFFNFHVGTGVGAPSVNIKQITDEEGRKAVMSSKRAETSTF